jgi:hypothetical protein
MMFLSNSGSRGRVGLLRLTLVMTALLAIGSTAVQALDFDSNPGGSKGGSLASPDGHGFLDVRHYSPARIGGRGTKWANPTGAKRGSGASTYRLGGIGDQGLAQQSRFYGPGRHRVSGFDSAPGNCPKRNLNAPSTNCPRR